MADDHAGLDMGDLASPATAYGGVGGDFQVVRRGYDQRQVDSHLDRLDAEIRILIADRNAAVEQAAQRGRELDESRARAERLRVQVRALVSPPTSLPGMSERMRSMLRLAEDEVSEMLTQADAEAIRRRHDAELEAGEIRSAALADAERSAAEDAKRRAECDAEIAAAAAEMAAHRRAFEAELERERMSSSARISRAEEDARIRIAEEQAAWEARRALVEEDFLRAMDQRRAEALAELERNRIEIYRRNSDMIAAAQEQSARTITAADDYAVRTVAEAKGRVAELADARERVAAQLAQARAALALVLGELSATPERDVPASLPEVAGPIAPRPDADTSPTGPVESSGAGRAAAWAPVAAAAGPAGGGPAAPGPAAPTPAAPTPAAPAAATPAAATPAAAIPTAAEPAAGFTGTPDQQPPAAAPPDAEGAVSPASPSARPDPPAAPRTPESADSRPSGSAAVVPLPGTDATSSSNGAQATKQPGRGRSRGRSSGSGPYSPDGDPDGANGTTASTARPAGDGTDPNSPDGEGPKRLSTPDAGPEDPTPVSGAASARRRTRRPSPRRS
ncbi:MAG: hypothetical protein AB7J32_02490 [Pseudonocardia sp.]